MSVPNPAAAQPPPPPKPIWKRWYIWAGIIAVLIVISGIVNALNPDDPTDDAAPAETASETPTEEPVEEPSAEPAAETDEAEDPEPSEDDTFTTGGLDQHEIARYCEAEAEAQAFPYAIDVKTFWGVKLVQIDGEEIRVLYEADLESGQGGEMAVEVLCIATGTPNNVIIETLEIR